MGEVTREELAAMTDQELLAYERAHPGDPYVTLLRAKGMQRVALRFWHVGAARQSVAGEHRRSWAGIQGTDTDRPPQFVVGCRFTIERRVRVSPDGSAYESLWSARRGGTLRPPATPSPR
jgi:hypothetical protein